MMKAPVKGCFFCVCYFLYIARLNVKTMDEQIRVDELDVQGRNTSLLGSGISLVLLVFAIYMAYKHKKGAWGYVGYIVLAGMVGTGVNVVINQAKKNK